MSFFDLIITPKEFNGFITLEKSLLERLLSPTNLILYFVAEQRPKIHLASVPEFPAFKIVLFLGMFCSDKKFIAACPSL